MTIVAVMAALGLGEVGHQFNDCCLERDKEGGTVRTQLLWGGNNLGRIAREEAWWSQTPGWRGVRWWWQSDADTNQRKEKAADNWGLADSGTR